MKQLRLARSAAAAAMAVVGMTLASLGSPVESAPCRGTGELDPPLQPDEFWHTAFSDASGFERTTLFQVPASAPPGNRDLVIVLHGGGGDDREDILSDMRGTGWVELAESDGFVLAWPTALQNPQDDEARLQWNDGRLGTDIWAMPDNADIDDAGYIAETMDFAQQNLNVGSRIFVVGVSNGGMLALRLASDRRVAGRITAMATLIAQLPVERIGERLDRIPLLMFSASADPLIPFEGGAVVIQAELDNGAPLGDPVFSSAVVSFADTVTAMVTAHGCSASPLVRPRTDIDGDGVYVRTETYCLPSRQVQAHVIVGGGHRWPGIGDNSPDWTRECDTVQAGPFTFNYYVYVGAGTQDGFFATPATWQFFQRQ